MESEFYCVKCKNRGIPIPRPKRRRESGHLKKMWCLNCKSEQNHVEIIPFTHYAYDDFLLEFEYGNFTETGSRKEKYGIFKDSLQKKGIIE